MGRKRIDLTGQVFGRLTVVEYSHCKQNAYWKCLCECGVWCVVNSSSFKSGHTSSCGCLKRDKATSHGMSSTSEYNIWQQMLQRCTNTNSKDYPEYGGRGITVCESWLLFENFYAAMGPRPSKDHTLDRKDNDGPYSKENCRWATSKEQSNNRRSNNILTHNGATKTISQWSEISGIPYETLWSRVVLGWDMDRALTEPVGKQNKRGDI